MHKIADTHYLLCVNAANQDEDFEYIVAHNRFGAQAENAGDRYSQLAIQGPRALEILERLTTVPLSARFAIIISRSAKVSGVQCLIARTGYTGEDGFEIYFPPEYSARSSGTTLLEAGANERLVPCGLGARNTLRLEAGMCLYGHEIDDGNHAARKPILAGSANSIRASFWAAKPWRRRSAPASRACWPASRCWTSCIARDGYPVLDFGA